jgi:hypothetical protein
MLRRAGSRTTATPIADLLGTAAALQRAEKASKAPSA